jgi:hypothetical protein
VPARKDVRRPHSARRFARRKVDVLAIDDLRARVRVRKPLHHGLTYGTPRARAHFSASARFGRPDRASARPLCPRPHKGTRLGVADSSAGWEASLAIATPPDTPPELVGPDVYTVTAWGCRPVRCETLAEAKKHAARLAWWDADLLDCPGEVWYRGRLVYTYSVGVGGVVIGHGGTCYEVWAGDHLCGWHGMVEEANDLARAVIEENRRVGRVKPVTICRGGEVLEVIPSGEGVQG